MYCTVYVEVTIRSTFTKTSAISAMPQLVRVIHTKLHLVKPTVKL